VLAERCAPISGSAPVRFDVTPPKAGTLRIYIEQRGVSLVAQAVGLRSDNAISSAQSPIERFGVATFVGDAKAQQPITVTVSSRDSPEIEGEVCFSAARLNPDDARGVRAEREFAAAGALFDAGKTEDAFAHYLAAASDFDRIDRRRAAESRHAMADLAYWRISREGDAYTLAGWALAGFGQQADPAVRGALLMLQVESLLDSPPPGATRVAERSSALMSVSQRLVESSRFGAREVPRLDLLRGFLGFQADRTTEAAAYFSKAATECERLKDWECYAIARQNIATQSEEASNITVALQVYADALQSLPPGLKPQLRADISGNLGRLQGRAGLFRQSEQSHRESIQLYATTGNCDGTRIGLARLGTLLVQVGSIAEGRTYLSRAASLDCRALLAAAVRDDPDTEGLDRGLRAARPFVGCPMTPPPETLSATSKLAVFNALLGLREAARLENREDQAKPCLAAAHPYAFAPRMQLRLANAEGAASLERRDARGARAEFEDGIAIADGAGLPRNHENRSLAYLGLARAALLDKQPDAARSEASRALVMSSARADVGQIVDSLQVMARSQEARAGTPSAESILSTAAHLIEQVPIHDLDAEKRATWLATQHAVFADLTNLFAESRGAEPEASPDETRLWKAFEISERGRSRSLRYAANFAGDGAAAADSNASSDRYHALMTQLVALGENPSEQDSSKVIDALADIAATGGAPVDTESHEMLQRQLSALDATAIEYAVGRDDMLAFVLDSGHITAVRLGSRNDIAAATYALYDRLRDPEAAKNDLRKAAERVAALVWWPIAEHVTHRRVLVIPDDSLHTVPFAVLPWSAGADSPTLLERVELSVMPSMMFVTRPRRVTPRGPARFELIGDPVFRTGDWQRECAPLRSGSESASSARDRASASMPLPRLLGSRAEVLAIQELARRARPGTSIGLRLRCEATPQGLREAAAAAPALLHIATHGYVDAYRPRLSALALTPEAAVQGGTAWFDLLDILDTKVATRLVVLSACDTSRGRLLAGEGVLGPAQAFLQAGASSVIASYWRIADAETAPFMQTFYRYLLDEHLTAAEALRRTQLEFAKTSSPHVWAAFTLYGWPDTAL
jgi:CHAT domain-containing protein